MTISLNAMSRERPLTYPKPFGDEKTRVVSGLELGPNVLGVLLEHVDDPVEMWHCEYVPASWRAALDGLAPSDVNPAVLAVLLDLRVQHEVGHRDTPSLAIP